MASPLWNDHFQLALASKSATRRELLTSAGLPFVSVEAEIDERAVEADALAGGLARHELARALATAKALAASRALPDAYCLGADQILIAGDEILHKSPDLDDVAAKLARLSGRMHRLISGFAIARNGAVLHADDDVAELTMRQLTPAAITLYVEAAGDVLLTSVGGYQLEKLGVHLFSRVSGDHTTILGLPMLKLLAWLRTQGMVRI
jgi:septum formation protein